MKTLRHIALLTLAILTTSCSQTDDIDEIFTERTWHVTNIYSTATNMSVLKDSRILYNTTDSYYITFGKGHSLTGHTHTKNSEISGTWNADGANQKLIIKAQGTTGASDYGTSELMLKVLNAAQTYDGDSNVLTIRTGKDGKYYMTLSRTNPMKN